MKQIIILLTVLLVGSPVLLGKSLEVSVGGMFCAFCAQGIEKKFKEQGSAEEVKVDLEKKTVTIKLKKGKEIKEKAIEEIIKTAGFNIKGLKELD